MDSVSSKKVAFVLEPVDTASYNVIGLDKVAEVKLGRVGARYTEDELIQEAQDVDALFITSRDSVSRRVMEACKKLKVIVKYGSKPDNVDLQAATEMGIAVSWTPGTVAVCVAEHALLMMLALLKRLFQNMNGQKNGEWRDVLKPSIELQGKTVGLIGLGQIASELVKRLSCFNVEIVGYDPYLAKERAEQLKVKMVGLDELLRISDIISLHCELNKDTERMINAQQLRQMKKSAFIVNTARGGLIDTEALYNALKEGIIAGAGIDVFAEEPTNAYNPLFDLENCIHTPHMAGVTFESQKRARVLGAEEALSILKGEGGENVLNPEYIKNARK